MPTAYVEATRMSMYRRVKLSGAAYFFTVTLADRRATHLIDHVDRLRDNYRTVCQRRPFETIAICILPNHLHAIWQLPDGDSNFSTR